MLERVIIWVFSVILMFDFNAFGIYFDLDTQGRGVRERIILKSEGQTCFAVTGLLPESADNQCTK